MKNDFLCEVFIPENFNENLFEWFRKRNLSNAINKLQNDGSVVCECWAWSWWEFQDKPN